MDEVKILQIKQSVFANNDQQAELLRRELKEKGVFFAQFDVIPRFWKNDHAHAHH